MINKWDILSNELLLPSPIQNLASHPQLGDCQVHIKREDLIHPIISGNKWRKLKYNLLQAIQTKKKIVSFGGAFSNHIYALAGATKALGLSTSLYIRGSIDDLHNPTLRFCRAAGVELMPLSREDYRRKEDKDFINVLTNDDPDVLIIPEGGSNILAYKGLTELADEIAAVRDHYDFIAVSAGTGMTAASLIDHFNDQVVVYPALKGDFMQDEIKRFMLSDHRFHMRADYHFGGYGKTSNALTDFINSIKKHHSILLDPIYTAKLLYGILRDIEQGFFPAKSRILMIHTGGLQGVDAYNYRWQGKYGVIDTTS